MTKGQNPQSKELLKSLTLDIEGSKLSFDKCIKAQEQLAILLHEVDRTVADQKRPAVDWVISQVQGGSIHLTLEGIPNDKVEPLQIAEVLKVVEAGMTNIVKMPERPRCFSDKALRSAKKLAKLVDKDVFMIQLGINYKRISLNQHIVANVDEIIGGKYKSFGTVEGILKAIDLSRNPLFRVYDLLTNKSVRCYFDNQSTSMDMIKKALEQRVAISGLITSREDGDKISINVEDIEIFPQEYELPTITEMIGILGGEG
jgi:hypothetical protein